MSAPRHKHTVQQTALGTPSVTSCVGVTLTLRVPVCLLNVHFGFMRNTGLKLCEREQVSWPFALKRDSDIRDGCTGRS